MTATDNLLELLGLWEADQRIVRVLYARAGGETAVRIQGAVRLLSASRLEIRGRDASLVLPLSGARLEYKPLQFVPPPFTKLESIDGLHIWLKANDWAFVTDGREIPDDVAQLAVQAVLSPRRD
jgi:hypothetical protein